MSNVLEPHPVPGDTAKPVAGVGDLTALGPAGDRRVSRRAGRGGASPRGVSPLRVGLRQFRSHRPAMFGLAILILLYLLTIFCGYVAPYHYDTQAREAAWAPPTPLRFSDADGFSVRPFIHPVRTFINDDFETVREQDTSRRAYLRLLVRGDRHHFVGLIPTNLHLFGFDDLPSPADTEALGDSFGEAYFVRFFLLGSDQAGRDVFSRICYGSRVSMTIGLLGASIVFVIGMLVGGTSGYFGGWVDDILQRLCEMVMLLPGFYLLLMLRFVFPQNLDSTTVYFAVVLILALVGWAGFARVIRGMVLSIRTQDFVTSARAIGRRPVGIIVRHVLPNTLGYAIVSLTLSIPAYILGEAALSLLGLGIMEPVPSWGNMLQRAMDLTQLSRTPWVLWPGLFIFLAVMAFNLVGDGLRDAFDPRARRRE